MLEQPIFTEPNEAATNVAQLGQILYEVNLNRKKYNYVFSQVYSQIKEYEINP